ncbi:hypothetical protein B0I37DRAFT_165251 [Chaetomium sp. MPI-CAGE-AT-0009]|nr:hypothetical protein B0I37DRAFT_165251 [Chaetomium sp. MPI-CAGE-AT-0009]
MLVACPLPLAGRLSAVTSRVALLGAGQPPGDPGWYVTSRTVYICNSSGVGALGLPFQVTPARIKPEKNAGLRLPSHVPDRDVTKPSSGGDLLISGAIHGRLGLGWSSAWFVDITGVEEGCCDTIVELVWNRYTMRAVVLTRVEKAYLPYYSLGSL